MIDKKRKSRKAAAGTGKNKSAGKWFSLDSLMGKILCILLVVILTVGAFLAPKMINNLYDKGTLMQITYTDMDLSTFAVAYTSFQDKIMAIARAKTAGDKLVVLSAEESDEKVSDEELVQIVNQEMDHGVHELFDNEEWWSELTEYNLISREKMTAYAQAQMNIQDNISRQEMAPIQFWILSFEITQEQKQEGYRLYEEMTNTAKGRITESDFSIYGTDRLIVCLDAEFLKIYAVAIAGDEWKMQDSYEKYGWYMPDVFMVDGNRYQEGLWDDYADLRMYFTDQTMLDWIQYWEVTPEDKSIYLNIPGELSGCIAFQDGQAGTAGTDMGAADDSMGTAAVVGEEMYVGQYDAYILDSASDVVYGNLNEENRNEILLEVGLKGSYDESDGGMWIQKSGCRDFFEMMQF